MNTKIITIALALLCISTYSSAKDEVRNFDKDKSEQLTISFDFKRGGIASSQYAIWIENEKGELIRTLYATSFTAKGGYKTREDAIPIWVKKAKIDNMTQKQVDAISGATPKNGSLSYSWDGKNDNGEAVPAGKYHFFVEGTLYWKSRVLFSGIVGWEGNAQNDIPVKVQYFNPSSTNNNMISSLKASYR